MTLQRSQTWQISEPVSSGGVLICGLPDKRSFHQGVATLLF